MASTSTPIILRDLGDGLILRRSTAADAQAIAEHNSWVQGAPDAPHPVEEEVHWTLDLMRGNHPTFREDDFTVVEDVHNGKIVSVMNLIDQVWSYGGIPFGVGRPESVATLPEYRNRGLVRAQFEVVHQWSAERGHLVQGITGIPYFYRQFGYEMAVDLEGGRIGYGAVLRVPALKSGESEAFRLRPVTEADLPFVLETDACVAKRWLVACVRDATLWRYEIFGQSARSLTRLEWRIVETTAGEPVGYLGHGFKLDDNRNLHMPVFELKPGASWLAVAPAVLRYLRTTAESFAVREGKELMGMYASLGPGHPFLRVVRGRMPAEARPYAWYLRVPDLPAFLRHIAPVLEERLANSVAPGFTGELKLSLYRRGLRLTFDAGRLVTCEAWRPRHEDQGSAAFPGLTFLQLLFGYRTLDELRAAFTDCWVDGDDARVLIEALFPKQPSSIWPVS